MPTLRFSWARIADKMNSLKTMKKFRDYQRQAVYDWENKLIAPKDTTAVPFEQIQNIVNYVWQMEGLRYPPSVVPLAKQSKRVAAWGSRLEVAFPEQTKTWIILHELAHSMTSNIDGESNHHGARYLGIYMQLLNRYLKVPMAEMIDSATAAGLKFDIYAKPVFLE